MKALLAALPALGCVVMMPAMMWLMNRGRDDKPSASPPTPPGSPGSAPHDEARRLRDEVARLRSEIEAESDRREPAGG